MKRPHANNLTARAGFTFIEVLFALIILGVGMIMVAALLPVAIKQNADTYDDVTARTVAANAWAVLDAAVEPETANLRATGQNWNHGLPAASFKMEYGAYFRSNPILPNNAPSFAPWFNKTNVFGQTLGMRIYADDARFAWVPFYFKRGKEQPSGAVANTDSDGGEDFETEASARILVIRIRNTDATSVYPPNFFVPNASSTAFTQWNPTDGNGAHRTQIRVIDGNDTNDYPTVGSYAPGVTSPDLLVFLGQDSNDLGPLVAADGAFVIVSQMYPDTLASAATETLRDRHIGRALRLARRVAADDPATQAQIDSDLGGQVWELDPAYSLPEIPTGAGTFTYDTALNGNTIFGWIVGRGLADPTKPYDPVNNPFAGPAQDVYITDLFTLK